MARLPDHAKGMDAQADAILALLRAVPTAVVLCAHDGTIEAIRARRTEIERLTAPALAPEPGLAAAVSKTRTLEIAGRLGLATPRSVELRSATELRAALAETGLPAVVKPARSWTDDGRVAPVAVVDLAGASDAVAGLLSADAGAILQEWIPGRREAVSLFAAHGRTCGRFAQVAHSMFPALGGASVLRESIPLPADAAAAAERLIDAMGLTGYAEVEFRRDAGGRPVLMEVNPRLSASVEIAVRAGVDFPLLLYRWASGVPLVPCGGYRVGLRMRWLGGDLHRLLESARRRPGPDVLPPGRAMTRFLADFARPAAYDYVSVEDPVPMLAATRTMLADAGRLLLQAARPVTRRDSG